MLGWFKKKPSPPHGPDFSHVDSREKAEALFRRGELEKLFLMPLEFGGEDNPLNTLYVPIGLAEIKASIDSNVIGPLAAAGKITKYTATPEYQGNSFIPIAIKVVASDPANSPPRSTFGVMLCPAGKTLNLVSQQKLWSVSGLSWGSVEQVFGEGGVASGKAQRCTDAHGLERHRGMGCTPSVAAFTPRT